jgi:hypothetical protein
MSSSKKSDQERDFAAAIYLSEAPSPPRILFPLYTVKNVTDFPIFSRNATNRTLPGREELNYSRPVGVWLVTTVWGQENREPFLRCMNSVC